MDDISIIFILALKGLNHMLKNLNGIKTARKQGEISDWIMVVLLCAIVNMQ